MLPPHNPMDHNVDKIRLGRRIGRIGRGLSPSAEAALRLVLARSIHTQITALSRQSAARSSAAPRGLDLATINVLPQQTPAGQMEAFLSTLEFGYCSCVGYPMAASYWWLVSIISVQGEEALVKPFRSDKLLWVPLQRLRSPKVAEATYLPEVHDRLEVHLSNATAKAWFRGRVTRIDAETNKVTIELLDTERFPPAAGNAHQPIRSISLNRNAGCFRLLRSGKAERALDGLSKAQFPVAQALSAQN